jgi:hypothetical protein
MLPSFAVVRIYQKEALIMAVIINTAAESVVVTVPDRTQSFAFSELDHLEVVKTNQQLPTGADIWQCFAITKKKEKILMVNNTEEATKDRAKSFASSLKTTIKEIL